MFIENFGNYNKIYAYTLSQYAYSSNTYNMGYGEGYFFIFKIKCIFVDKDIYFFHFFFH